MVKTRCWRLVRDGHRTGAYNMAADRAIYRSVLAGEAPPTLRLYGWQPPAVSIGYAQEPQRDVDLEACRGAGVDVVRRITGGRAVLHHLELTYSICCPEHTPYFPDDINGTYYRISLVLQKALESLGVPCRLAPPARTSSHRDRASSLERACFLTPSRHELVCDGRKIVGSAQKRGRGAFLQHGSILLDFDADLFLRVFRGDPNDPEQRRRLLEQIAWVNQAAPGAVDFEAAVEAVTRSFTAVLGVKLREEALRGEEARWAQAAYPGLHTPQSLRVDPPT